MPSCKDVLLIFEGILFSFATNFRDKKLATPFFRSTFIHPIAPGVYFVKFPGGRTGKFHSFDIIRQFLGLHGDDLDTAPELFVHRRRESARPRWQ